MGLTRITAPEEAPVSVDTLLEHLRVEPSYEDLLLDGYIKAATQRLDGRDGLLGRCLVAQRWRLTLDRFAREIVLPLPPCISVEGVGYLDAAGEEVELDVEAYRVTGLGSMDGARIRAAAGTSWPETEEAFVEFTAGFGSASDVPEPLRVAIMLHAAHLFEHREDATGAPQGYDDLIRDFRVWGF